MDLIEHTITVHDQMQSGYQYVLVEPEGSAFREDFLPQLSPREMLELGVFGGKYMTDCTAEFPEDWFINARLSPEKHDPHINYFRVSASQSLAEWNRKGWIFPDDPRGWFQWYCRYYLGRRGPDDDRQIRRWKAMTRHIAQLKKNCPERAMDCRRRQRQALLQWAYDTRKM